MNQFGTAGKIFAWARVSPPYLNQVVFSLDFAGDSINASNFKINGMPAAMEVKKAMI